MPPPAGGGQPGRRRHPSPLRRRSHRSGRLSRPGTGLRLTRRGQQQWGPDDPDPRSHGPHWSRRVVAIRGLCDDASTGPTGAPPDKGLGRCRSPKTNSASSTRSSSSSTRATPRSPSSVGQTTPVPPCVRPDQVGRPVLPGRPGLPLRSLQVSVLLSLLAFVGFMHPVGLRHRAQRPGDGQGGHGASRDGQPAHAPSRRCRGAAAGTASSED